MRFVAKVYFQDKHTVLQHCLSFKGMAQSNWSFAPRPRAKHPPEAFFFSPWSNIIKVRAYLEISAEWLSAGASGSKVKPIYATVQIWYSRHYYSGIIYEIQPWIH